MQESLAAIRTDLDSFSDGEADALMLSGYRMMSFELGRRSAAGLSASPDRPRWRFADIDEALREPVEEADLLALVARPARHAQLRRLLDVAAGKGSDDRTVRVWSLDRAPTPTSVPAHAGAATALSPVLDGQHVVSAGDDGSMYVWDPSTGRRLVELTGEAGITALAAPRNASLAVVGLANGVVDVWDLNAPAAPKRLRPPGSPVSALAAVPDGRRVVVASHDGGVTLWDLTSGKTVRDLPAPQSHVSAMAVTPDGGRVILGAANGALGVVDLESGALVLSPEGHSLGVNAITVSADGRLVLSAGADSIVRGWELASGRDQKDAAGRVHSAAVTGVALLADARHVVSSALDGTLVVCVLGGQPLARFYADGALLACAVAGSTLVAAEDSGRVHFLRLEGAA